MNFGAAPEGTGCQLVVDTRNNVPGDLWEWQARVRRHLQVWELVNTPAPGELVEIPEERVKAIWEDSQRKWILISVGAG